MHFCFSFATNDGIERQEVGRPGFIEGRYSYTGDDGRLVREAVNKINR